MGAVDDGVLEREDIVVLRRRLIIRVLQSQAAELGCVPFEQCSCCEGRVAEIVQRRAREGGAGVVGRETSEAKRTPLSP